MFVGLHRSLLHILELRLHDSCDADFCANLNLGGCDLRVIAMSAQFTRLLNLAVSAFSRCIITEDLNRHLASMEATVASTCSFLFVLFADLVLEATALQILVKTLVCFHLFLPFCFPLLNTQMTKQCSPKNQFHSIWEQ